MSKRSKYSIQIAVPLLLLLFSIIKINAQCPGTTTLTVLENRIGVPNEIVCFDIIAEGFQNIEIFSLPIQFDPNVLAYVSCDAPNLPSFTCSASNTPEKLAAGVYTMLWFGSDPLDITNGDTLITLCFEVIGQVGQSSLVTTLATPSIFENGNLVVPATDIEIIKVGCTDPTSNSTVPASLSVGCSMIDVGKKSCPATGGQNNGSITFQVCGGVGPYNYEVGGITGTVNEMEEETVNGLSAGSYSINITDSNGTPFTSLGTEIIDGAAISFSAPPLVTDRPTCDLARPTGRIELFPTGGSPPYKYNWETTPASLNPLDGLGVGTYNVTVSDNNGCEITESIDLAYNPLSFVDIQVQDVACGGSNGPSNGSMTITMAGGRPEINAGQERYRFEIGNNRPFRFSNPATIMNLPAGDIRVRVYDNSLPVEACFIETTVTIGAAKSFELDLTTSNNDCTAGGIINVNARALQGSDPLSSNLTFFVYEASDLTAEIDMITGSNSVVQFSGLTPGDYVVELTDNDAGCSFISDPATVTASTGAGLTFTTDVSPPGCGELGMITIQGLGDPADYEFIWNDGLTITGDNQRIGLSPNNYNVIVRELATGCEGTLDDFIELRETAVNLDTNDPSSVDVRIQDLNCPGDVDGTITYFVVDPIVRPGLAFQWYKDGAILTGETTSQITGLGPGEYRVEVSGDEICPTDATFTFNDPPPLQAIIDQEAIVCFGSPVNLSAREANGRTGLTYSWDNGLPDGQLQQGIMAGTYNLVVSDPVSGCSDDTTFVVQQYEPFQINFTNIQDNTCFGDANGEAAINVTGGSGDGDLLYTWSTAPDQATPNQNILSNLENGEYTVLVFDNQCSSEPIPFEITGGNKIQIDDTNSIITEPRCFGEADGAVELSVTGGSGNFDLFRLRNLETDELVPSFTNTVTGLVAGEYAVQITDDASCAGIDTIMVTQPDSLTYAIDSSGLVTLSCNASNTGIIRTIQSGGNEGPLNYSWSHDVTLNSPVATNLGEATYTSVVTDSRGCTAMATYEMLAPQEISLDFETTQFVQCFGTRLNFGGLQPSGGTNTGFRYSINNGSLMPVADSVLLFAGNYDLVVYDQDGCSLDTAFTVIEPSEVVVELGPDVEINLGDTHQLRAEHDPDEDIIRYVWDPSEVSGECIDCPVITVAPENDTVYGVRIENSDGCADEDEVMIRVKRNRNIYIPNVLYTGKSNSNSSFKLFSGQGVERIEYLRIFDRWGNLVHEVQQLTGSALGTGDWDARLKGTLVESGVYVYMARILFTDGEFLDYKGDITVIH